MTEISFYHLTSTTLERALPKLMEKVFASGQRALLVAPDEARVEELNQLMWTYSTRTFLPHGSKQDDHPEEQPIYLTTQPDDNPNQAAILVLVGGIEVDSAVMSRYTRCLELFDGQDETELAQARSHWKRYQQEEHTLTYWKQTEKGSWDKQSSDARDQRSEVRTG